MARKKDLMRFQRTRRYAAGVKAINDAGSDTGKLKTALLAHGKRMDLDMVSYNRLTSANKDAIISELLSEKPGDGGYASRLAVAEVFNPALSEKVAVEYALLVVNAAKTAGRMEEALLNFAEILELDTENYLRLSDDGKETVCDAVITEISDNGEFATASALTVFVENAAETELETEALGAINAAKLEEVAAVLAVYFDVYGIDDDGMDDYSALDDETGKPVVHDALQGKNFASVGDVKTAFDTAVLTQAGLEEAAILAVNAADNTSDMETALGNHKTVIGIAEIYDAGGDYDELSDKSPVLTAMVAGRDFETIAAVRELFIDEVAKQKAVEAEG